MDALLRHQRQSQRRGDARGFSAVAGLPVPQLVPARRIACGNEGNIHDNRASLQGELEGEKQFGAVIITAVTWRQRTAPLCKILPAAVLLYPRY